jgi:hypothetical protein
LGVAPPDVARSDDPPDVARSVDTATLLHRGGFDLGGELIIQD